MAKSRQKVQARMRAREAKAKVDARRAERDEKISTVQTAYFVALAERDEAEEAIVKADDARARAIQSLTAGDLKVSVDDAADLCELTPSEVRALKKRQVPDEGTDDGTDDGTNLSADATTTEGEHDD